MTVFPAFFLSFRRASRWLAALAALVTLGAASAVGVTKGREPVNFSEWASYSPDRQRLLLAASCDDATSGTMPGAYALVRPETRLSARDIETFCKAAR